MARSATLDESSSPRRKGARTPSPTVTDVASASPELTTAGVRPDSAVVRVAFSILSLISLLVGTIAYALGDGNVRVIAFLLFGLVGIGSAPLALHRTLTMQARLALSFLISMSVLTFTALLMSTYSFWHPVPAFIAVATVATGLHVVGLMLGWPDLIAVRRARPADERSSRQKVTDAARSTGFAWTLLVVGTGLWLSAALTHRHITPGFGGFLTEVGPAWYAGVILVIFGLFAARGKPERVAATAVVLLMLALTLTPSLAYDGGRSATGARHVGLVQQIRAGSPLDTNILIYNYWNGFFAAMAWLSDILGIKDPTTFSAYWPSVIGIFRIAALRYLIGRFFRNHYHAWTAVALCVLADPIGADYYSPQSVGFVYGMTALAIAFSPLSIRQRGPAMLLAGCVLAVSHQLSPYATAVALIGLVIFRQVQPWWSPLLVLLPANAWALIHRDALSGFISISDIGQAQNFSPPKTIQVEGLVRLPIVAQASYGLVLGIFVLAALAGLAILRFHDRKSLGLGFCAASGFIFVAVSPYGNEGIFRAFLFSIPWFSILAMRWISTRSWERWAMMGLRPIIVGMLGTFLVAAFGMDAVNVVNPGDLQAVRAFESTVVKPTDSEAFMLQLGDGNLPGNLAPKSARQTEIVRLVIDDPVSEINDEDSNAAVARITDKYLVHVDQEPTTANLYAIWSPLSSEFNRAYALEKAQTFANLRDAFIASPYWDMVFSKDGTVLLKFDGAAYPKA